MSEVIYCGSARIVNTKFGDITKVSFSASDLKKMAQYMDDNQTEWVNMDVLQKKDPQEGKPTHYLKIDQWKAGGRPTSMTTMAAKGKTAPALSPEDDDLPF